jgi:hypothetical protein
LLENRLQKIVIFAKRYRTVQTDTHIIVTETAKLAASFINQTSKHIFLTGKAGTGKTTFLKELSKYTFKQTVVVAPTGIAAINAGGTTIHSFFQLPFGCYIPQPVTHSQEIYSKINDPVSLIKNLKIQGRKREIIRKIELLVIDEVSMLRSDLLDAIDTVLRHIRGKHYIPFGGVQMLFIGDMYQLPPVVKDQEWMFLKPYYKSQFFFDALALQTEKPIFIELDKIFRQDNIEFISLLNHLRTNEINEDDVKLLNSKYQPDYEASIAENIVTVTTHNYKADDINRKFLESINEESITYEALINKDFGESLYPIEKEMILKKGSQVMFIKNDPSGEMQFFNGKLGKVERLTKDEIYVLIDGNSEETKIDRYIWENIRYTINKEKNEIEEEIIGTFSHYPIKLAWAITVHKSQGLTFERAILDITDSFAPGQVYVALSRLRSLDGLILKTKIRYQNLSIDERVLDYDQSNNHKEELLEKLDSASSDYYRDKALEAFTFDPIARAFIDIVDYLNSNNGLLNKQEYLESVLTQQSEFNKTIAISTKFIREIVQIHHLKEEHTPNKIIARVDAASGYFLPILKEQSAQIIDYLSNFKVIEDVNDYINKIIELELLTHEQFRGLLVIDYILKSALSNQLIDKENIRLLQFDENREEILQKFRKLQHRLMYGGFDDDKPSRVKPSKKKRKPKKDNTIEKEVKIPSRDISFQSFKSGKTIEEIAIERGCAPQTVLNHLTWYIKEGQLEKTQLMEQSAIDEITDAAMRLNSSALKPILEILDGKFSYDDIRIALIGMVFESEIEAKYGE